MTTKTPRFIDHGDGTVTDTWTGLMWTKATVAKGQTHAKAVDVAATLDVACHKDWRLPTVEELFLLADRSRTSPAIDTDAFPDTANDWYWSSTPCAWDPSCAWFVVFSFGYAFDLHRFNYACVRAVRSVEKSP